MALEGKVAIITGAGTGIGKATALAFLNDGYRIAFAGRRRDMLENAIEEAGDKASHAIAVPRFGQVGLVVKDAETVAQNYWNILGIGPWNIYSWEEPLVYDRKYHDKPAWARAKIAQAQVGAVQLELYQPIEGNSIYGDFLRERGEGLHHISFFVDNVDETAEELVKEGFPSLESGRYGDNGAYNCLDTKPLRTLWQIVQRPTSMGVEPIRSPKETA